jgi:hypothetical protein
MVGIIGIVIIGSINDILADIICIDGTFILYGDAVKPDNKLSTILIND